MSFGSRRQSHKNRAYQVRKDSIKDKLIDQQILAIHRAIVEKLIAQPTLAAPLFDVLEQRRESGKLRYGAYLTWHCLLDNLEDHDAFRQGVLEDSPKMRRLRRTTPLVGVLTEDERQAAIAANAMGETNLDYLFSG